MIFTKHTAINLTTAFWVVVMLFGITSCKKEKIEQIAAVTDRKALPKLHANEITTVISDSGITRYRIYAKQWDVFDRATDPFWEFPKGIHFERFDPNLVIDANFHSNYARYFENRKLWEFRGKVKAINLQGEMFETDQLFWNQVTQRIYSDSLIKVTRKTQILTGIGFDSNQNLTDYSIRKLQGILAVEGNEAGGQPQTPPTTQQNASPTTSPTVPSPGKPTIAE